MPLRNPPNVIQPRIAKVEPFVASAMEGKQISDGLEVTIPDRAVLLQQFLHGLLLLWRNWQSAPTEEREAGLPLHQQREVTTPLERLDLVPPQQSPVLPEPTLSNLEPTHRHDQEVNRKGSTAHWTEKTERPKQRTNVMTPVSPMTSQSAALNRNRTLVG